MAKAISATKGTKEKEIIVFNLENSCEKTGLPIIEIAETMSKIIGVRGKDCVRGRVIHKNQVREM